MEPLRDDQLIADLQALRPTPRPQFAAELDEHAAAGFPRRSRVPRLSAPWLRSIEPRRVFLVASGAAIALIAIATVFVVSNKGGSTSGDVAVSNPQPNGVKRGDYFDGSAHYQRSPNAESLSSAGAASAGGISGVGAEVEMEGETTSSYPAQLKPFSSNLHHRAVERSAEITLAADPKDVNDDATRVFEAVHANNGIVMRSSTQDGRPGEAGATFDLLIPSAKLDDAMAAFSEIDAVRSRHEATADITAPTVSAAVLLKESRARIDSLLSQLGAAETEEEQEAIEAELRHERRHASRLAARISHLHNRADFSRVSLRIETGGKASSNGGAAWGVDNALHDAAHVLTVAAGVLLIALAILGPIALIALLAWLTHRAWVRRERRRILS